MSSSSNSRSIQLSKPKRLGYFSTHYHPETDSLSYSPHRSALRHYHSPLNNGDRVVDLTIGFSPDGKYGRTPQGEMYILRWIRDNNDPEREYELECDFICNSRPIRSMLEAPFNRIDDFKFVAIKVGRSIILEELDTDKRKDRVERQSYSANVSSYAGFKFIELATRGRDGSTIKIGSSGDRDSFYVVSKAKIGAHSVLYSHRIDCVINQDQYKKPVHHMRFVKLATRGSYWNAPKALQYWQPRAVRWWADYIVSGADAIFCGEKTKENRLVRVVSVDGKNLYRADRPWSPQVCYQNLNRILSLIKRMVKEDLVVYSMHLRPQGDPILQRLDEPVTKYVPKWFIEHHA